MTPALVLLAAYLIGAFPTSYLVGRLVRGIDLREHGSGNLGATNVYRLMGLRWALPVALVDMAKGAAPVLLLAPLASAERPFALLVGLVAVVGHSASVFVRFRGGKGVATGAGVILALAPAAAAFSLALWVGVVRLSGLASLGSILAALLLPALVAAWYPEAPETLGLTALLSAFVLFRHRSNMVRLYRGTEHRAARTDPRPGADRPPPPQA